MGFVIAFMEKGSNFADMARDKDYHVLVFDSEEKAIKYAEKQENWTEYQVTFKMNLDPFPLEVMGTVEYSENEGA